MVDAPVKIRHNDEWINCKISIGDESIVIPPPMDKTILLKNIIDLQEKKNTLTFLLKDGTDIRIVSVEKVLFVLKHKILMKCSAYRLMAHFMSPAIRGGVLVTNALWEKGAIVVLKTDIWCITQNKQICIPLADVTGIEMTKRDVDGKPSDVVRIDHLENHDVVSSFILTQLSTLQILYNFLSEATAGITMEGTELGSMDQQIAMLVYSGMDSSTIQNMLQLSFKELDSAYGKLIGLNMAEVKEIRREIQLTAKGVRYITDATKSGTN
ncbi:MAG: CheF family chemotaxis protein [Methanocalculus sp.]|uniref:CheF family chemotaxis protein n=1 Tax=Methanocalculus sp. TaxID=2004547 RepID=UPI00271B26D2|nr:CheF family chemotaxis protein [Methanocalculus sp.]MDO9539799.1 CheF family chemotaxis protein [Methanocalculus sp.]